MKWLQHRPYFCFCYLLSLLRIFPQNGHSQFHSMSLSSFSSFMNTGQLSLVHRSVLFITEVQRSTTVPFTNVLARCIETEVMVLYSDTHRGCQIVAGVNLCSGKLSRQSCTHKVMQIKQTHIHTVTRKKEGNGHCKPCLSVGPHCTNLKYLFQSSSRATSIVCVCF